MEITASQFNIIQKPLSVQRDNVKIPNLLVLNAILYVAEHGCKWRGLPKKFGHWHGIYTRANRWASSTKDLQRWLRVMVSCMVFHSRSI
ncbi:MAG: transposase [Gammaproteobacteria bacterium]|nr:transposase [Gammaproteobacteria bacterium]